jgi:peptidoglycan/LPS O-acetylase OafA/YrhL
VERNNLVAFLESRLLRIYPALIVSVVFCVFCIGWFMTPLPSTSYLLHADTRSFLWHNSTLLGLKYYLPGVFEHNPWPRAINGSLWTLPIELLMYCWVALLGIMGVLKDKKIFNLFFVLVIAMYVLNPDQLIFLGKEEHVRLAIYFLFGAFFYINAASIPYGKRPLLGLTVLAILLFKTKYYNMAFAFLFTYLVLYVSLSPVIRFPKIEKWGDFSYGIYLYAFPVTQILVFYLGGDRPYAICLITLVLTVLLSILSWYLIEKPCLRYKGKLMLNLKSFIFKYKLRNFKELI